MGFAISWLAVRGKSPEAVLQELGLTPTGEITDYAESLFTGRAVPSGWFLLVIDAFGHDFVQRTALAALARNCEVVACSIEEHVGFCSSELWGNGTQVWHVEHDAQKGAEHLSHSGSVPDGLAAIEREFSERQREADGKELHIDYYFEIPLQTAKSIVSFKHDEANPDLDDFEVFTKPTDSASTNRNSARGKKPWWKLW
jgi:hypothetical protein